MARMINRDEALEMAEHAHRNRRHWGEAMQWRFLLRWASGSWRLE